MRSPLCTLVGLAALIFCAASSPSHTGLTPSIGTHRSSSRRSGPLAKQRIQKRASLRSSTSRSRRTNLPYVEDVDEGHLLARMAHDDEFLLARRSVAPAVPGSSALALVSLDAILRSLGSGASSMRGHEENLKAMATKAPKNQRTRRFQNSVYHELQAYHDSLLSLPGLREVELTLKAVVGGNSNHNELDRAESAHSLLSAVVDSTESVLKTVDLIVFTIPILYLRSRPRPGHLRHRTPPRHSPLATRSRWSSQRPLPSIRQPDSAVLERGLSNGAGYGVVLSGV